MSDIETIGNEEQEIFDSPDSLGGSDLGQGPANPAFDGIAKQQSYADNGSEDLYHDDQHPDQEQESKDITYPASIKSRRAWVTTR